jgi:photosystem I reaction center subunit XII
VSEQGIKIKREESAKALTAKIQEGAAQLLKIYEPEWNSRNDVLKTIISVSSASIVLSVTFSSSLRTLNVDAFWRYSIVFSFAMLVVSLITAFIALRLGIKLYEIQSKFLDKRPEVNKALMEASSKEGFDKSFEQILTQVHLPMEKIDRLASRLLRISTVCFCAAIISLAVVGCVKLLS